MKAQAYLDMTKRQQQELTDFPIAYAFNEKQLEEALEKLGATKEECWIVVTQTISVNDASQEQTNHH